MLSHDINRKDKTRVCCVSVLTRARVVWQLCFLLYEPHTSVCTGMAGGCNGCSGRLGKPQRTWHSKQRDLVSDTENEFKISDNKQTKLIVIRKSKCVDWLTIIESNVCSFFIVLNCNLSFKLLTFLLLQQLKISIFETRGTWCQADIFIFSSILMSTYMILC